jgi:hypothetical protein
MFWSDKSGIELRKKHLFIAEFTNTNQTSRGGWGGVDNEKSIKLVVKKIDAPSINLNFERGLASNYVHYFQQGEINWEPINVTFVDAVSLKQDQLPNWKKMFFNYLSKSSVIAQNRTGMLDLPIFCDAITIYSKQTFSDLESPLNSVESSKLLTTEFIIFNPRITKISFGSYDYSSDDANEISVTFVPEWCEYNNVNGTFENNGIPK